MSTVLSECTACHCTYPKRERAELADRLHEAILLGDREPDLAKRHESLLAHLFWFEAELRGFCTNCTLSHAAELQAAASVEVTPVEPRIPGKVIDLGVRLKRRPASYEGSFYERAEPVRTSAMNSETEKKES